MEQLQDNLEEYDRLQTQIGEQNAIMATLLATLIFFSF